MSSVVIVTGASRGVGLGIVHLLSASTTPYTLYLTSRSGNDLPPSKAPHTFHSIKLDITDTASVKAFATRVEKEQGKEGVDALINNAGLNIENVDGKHLYDKENVRETMKTNYYGTRYMCDAFLPLLKKSGRIVNVASGAGHLDDYSKEAEQKLLDAATSLAKLDSFIKEYESLLEEGKELDAGFRDSAYCTSKAFMVALTKALAATHRDKLINTCCPGWVDTDMGGQMGKPPKSITEGAKIPVRLAVGDIGSSTGDFWQNPNNTDTGDGQISKW